MARKKNEFRPDNQDAGLLHKLYLTKKQRQSALRWILYAVVCVLALVLQDVVFSRLTLFGATTDLPSCAIVMTCVLLGAETGGVFALIASMLYLFSGSAPGEYAIVILTFLGITAAAFRQGYLRKGFSSTLLCTGVAMMLYELLVFVIELFLEHTIPSRLGFFVTTGLLSWAAMPILYPILLSIGKIGGETWKE